MGALLRIAWRNLLRGWRRSAIVVVAISVGLSGCMIVLGWTTGMIDQMIENAVGSHLAHVAVQARGYQQNPDLKRSLAGSGSGLIEVLPEGPGRPNVSPRLIGDGLIQSARKSLRAALVGVVPDTEPGVSVVPGAVVVGRYLDNRRRRVPEIVIGVEMAERLKVEPGDKIVMHVPGETGSGAFRIAGLYRTSSTAFDRSFAYVTLASAQQLFAQEDRVSQIAVRLAERNQSSEFRDWAKARLAQIDPEAQIEVMTWREREPRLAAMLDMMDQMSWVMYAVVFVGMAFGIANALLMAVYERIREFGVLRSIGLKGGRLVWMILLEALILTLAGTVLGLLGGLGLVGWLGEVGLDLSMFSEALGELGVGNIMYPTVRPRDLVAPVCLAILTALVAALWPAIKAYRLRPAEALRHV
ncbi:MAG: ABC transporter permease [bacterium]|nr:ABC transporter permease [bacterium]